MNAAKTRSQLGAMSRNKGAKAERDLVAYLRTVGFGGAERAVRTGYRTATRTAADPGDITGTPGIIWSVKDASVERLRSWLDELDAMEGDGTTVRLLVHKRAGKSDPSRWWCWMRLRTLLALDGPAYTRGLWADAGVRMELGHAVQVLRAAGYGDPSTDTEPEQALRSPRSVPGIQGPAGRPERPATATSAAKPGKNRQPCPATLPPARQEAP